MVQLTLAALERHLQGLTEKLRSGVSGKVREAIQQSVARILVGVDGTVMLETKPDGLLGVAKGLRRAEACCTRFAAKISCAH